MKRIIISLALSFLTIAVFAEKATVRLDATVKHQQVTGFGGFVCSPQFQYNHMSTTDIKKVWGKSSTVGCNIMRLYIPIGKSAWSQSLATAKNAKQMGLIVFASPWGQPAEWKTNGTVNAKNSDGTTGKLKKENWPDYAQYLEDYVQYLRQNGVELDAISIQNEPDWPASYAGCLWDASEIAEFVKTYGKNISCKVMAPETLAISDTYANALNKSDVLDCFDIYGGHQYGGIQSAYKNLSKKGKELWMTEYLINWNEAENNTRNFDFSKDFFNFFTAINTCMLGDFNAWIHYAAKRYYGMLGDGQRGTTAGVVTKRGYIMAHFARFVTGMTRIDATWNGAGLEGSAYLSESGDTVVAVVANTSNSEYSLTVDLPFYTTTGSLYTTSKTKNCSLTKQDQETETCRPTVSLAAQSVNTILFVRSRDRQPSQMKGSIARFDRLDDQQTTLSTFGTTYKMSNKSKTFDHSTPLISSRTTTSAGYIQLADRYTKLVMHVKKISSSMNYSSAKTTLYYINNNNQVATYNYGDIEFTQREEFDISFDLSPATLTDGCKGLLSLTNDNWSSKLTITFGDVYLTNGISYAATLSGAYVSDDSNVLDFSNDAACTSLDMTAVTNLPQALPWQEGCNRVVYVAADSPVTGANVVADKTCAQLNISETGGNFRPATPFTATQAAFTGSADGMRLLMLPFAATVPQGVKAYTLTDELALEETKIIPAHQPVLIEAEGEITLTGSGNVSYAVSPMSDKLRGTYVTIPLYAGDYVLSQQEGKWGLARLTVGQSLLPFGVYAHLSETADFLPIKTEPSGIEETKISRQVPANIYNMMGQRVSKYHTGIIVRNGKKYINK